MAQGSDKLFYLGWGGAIISLGLCVLLALSTDIGWGGAASLWLLLVGVALLAAGGFRLKADRKRAGFLVMSGMGLAAVGLIALVVIANVLNILQGVAVMIMLAGAGVLLLGMTRE